MVEAITSIGRYEIISELGCGAMARVYLARDPNIDRNVALKVLAPRGLVAEIEMEELRTRFLLEARAAGNLRHPAAVAIYDADHDADTGQSFIAMEWVDGQSLDEILKGPADLPVEQAITIICQMAAALDAAHSQGLVHRDVKPANILIDGQGNAKLSDFGIAKIESLELTSTGQILGTPFYMSPEQIRDESLDGRSDLFSLGVVLYQCVTAELPFHADSLPALTHKILNVDPRPPQFINRRLPDSICVAVNKSLEKDPERRFQSGAELASALGHEVVPPDSTASLTLRSSQILRGQGARTGLGKQYRWWGLLAVLALVATLIAVLPGIREADPFEAKEATPRSETDSTVQPPSTVRTSPAQDELSEMPAESDAPTSALPEATGDEQTSVPPPIAGTGSTLEISYTNRLKRATMDIWVDGTHVLSKPVSRTGGLVRRAVGRKLLTSIPVSPGHHDVKVRIRGSEGKIEVSNWSGNTFDKGQTRRLRLELIPPKYLKMAWK